MSSGKVYCKACGKAWQNFAAFSEDTVKCGKEGCTMLPPKQSRHAPKQEVTPIVETRISTGTVVSKIDPDKEAHMYQEVPKAIVMEVKRVRKI